MTSNLYATDGKCHNAERGTYGHECGKPATWLGTDQKSGFISGFCDACKTNGYEARGKAFSRIQHTVDKVPYVDTCIEHAYGTTTRLSFQIRVF